MIVPLLLAVDFMNYNYSKIPCSNNVPPPALIRNGSYSYFDEKMGTGFDVAVDAVKRGSLGGGKQLAVVVLACHYPIGGTAGAYVYDMHRNSAVLLGEVGSADWGGDWGTGPSSIHIRFAKHFLYVDTCKDTDCYMSEVRTYVLREGKLVKVYVQAHKTRDH